MKKTAKLKTKSVLPEHIAFPYTCPEDVVPALKSVNSTDKLFQKARQYLQLPDGPFLFIKDWLDINPEPWPEDKPPDGWNGIGSPPLWSRQRDILDALFRHRKVAVKSAHGTGKSFTAALAALTLSYLYKAIVVTTAPTFRQVRKVIWGEIHSIHSRANARLKKRLGIELGGKLNQTELVMGPKWYVIGFSTDDPDYLQGIHDERVFLIVDEAAGWPKELYDSAEGILTSSECYTLLIGNPTDPTGEFAKAFEPSSGYHTISVSAFDSPNVKNGRNVYPKLVAHDWPERMQRRWGEDSPMYKARVLAEFPAESEDSLIPWRYLQAALDRELPEDMGFASFSLDVARFGDDRTVLGMRSLNGKFRILWQQQGQSLTETAGRTIATWRDICETDNGDGNLEVPVNVDDIGLGGGVTDMLIDEDLPCNGINVGEAPVDSIDDWDHAEKYLNKRAQYFFRLRRAFMEGTVDIDDEDLARELSKIKYQFSRQGKIKIEAKEEYKKTYGYSPDLADCMMLAWAESEDSSSGNLGGWL